MSVNIIQRGTPRCRRLDFGWASAQKKTPYPCVDFHCQEGPQKNLHLLHVHFTSLVHVILYLFGSMCRRPRMHYQNASTWSIHGMSISPSFLHPAGLEHQSSTKPCEKPRKCGIRIQANLDCDKRNWQENSSCWWMFGTYKTGQKWGDHMISYVWHFLEVCVCPLIGSQQTRCWTPDSW